MAFIPWAKMAFAVLTSVAGFYSHAIGQILKFMAKQGSKGSWEMKSLSRRPDAQLNVEGSNTKETRSKSISGKS